MESKKIIDMITDNTFFNYETKGESRENCIGYFKDAVGDIEKRIQLSIT